VTKWLIFPNPVTYIAAATLLQWSKGEQNQLFIGIFGKVAELNWMWKKALEEFSNQVCTNEKVKIMANEEAT